jgi:hypothetical protein
MNQLWVLLTLEYQNRWVCAPQGSLFLPVDKYVPEKHPSILVGEDVTITLEAEFVKAWRPEATPVVRAASSAIERRDIASPSAAST